MTNWTNWKLGSLVWIAVFLAFELPAHFGVVPWPTLSRTVWDIEQWWSPTSLIVEVFLAVLLLHLVFRFSVIALLGVGAMAAIAVIVHLVWGVQ